MILDNIDLNLQCIYIDMDEVIVDLYSYIKARAPIGDNNDPRFFKEFFNYIEAHAPTDRFYRYLQPMHDFEKALEVIQWLQKKKHHTAILSSKSRLDCSPLIEEDKKIWLKENRVNIPALFSAGSEQKGLFQATYGYRPLGNILVDDFDVSGRAWENAGGIWIPHKNWIDTHSRLEQLLGS